MAMHNETRQAVRMLKLLVIRENGGSFDLTKEGGSRVIRVVSSSLSIVLVAIRQQAGNPCAVMACFLYAWELGASLGHIGRFEPVAQQLAQGGHQVGFAVRETQACPLLLGERFAWMQAPRFDGAPALAAPINYADILAGVGYADPAVLMGLTVAWRTLLQLARPALVFADHAPTAILAARTLGIPVMMFGSGFSDPPARSPFPPMRSWEAADEGQLAAREGAVLEVVNTVLAQLKAAPLAHLHQLFDVAEKGLVTLPGLDHYAERGAVRYWGMPTRLAGAAPAPVAWPPGAGPRVFAYLRQAPPVAAAMLDAIGRSGSPSIVYAPDWRGDAGLPATVAVSREPLDLARMTREADLAIAHGISTLGAFLMAGKPVLAVVNHLEQFLVALRIAQLGAGLVVRADGQAGDIGPALARLRLDASLAQRARDFASRCAGFDHDAVVAAICARALALASPVSC
jgi:hypothetical protein